MCPPLAENQKGNQNMKPIFKKFILPFVAFLGVALFGMAAISSRPNDIGPFNSTATINITSSSNVTSVTELGVSGFTGGVLYQYEIVCSADDAVDFSLYSKAGTLLETITTTTAIAGEIDLYPTFYAVNDVMSYKLENIASGTCDVEVTLWRR